MNEFLRMYRDNYLPRASTRFLSGQPIDIREYDRVQECVSIELHRILGSPVDA
jgi:hypothetical protein